MGGLKDERHHDCEYAAYLEEAVCQGRSFVLNHRMANLHLHIAKLLREEDQVSVCKESGT